MGRIVLTPSAFARGTQNAGRDKPFLTAIPSPYSYLNFADGAKIRPNFYSNFLRISDNETPRALAIFILVKSVGARLLLSIKLIAGRVTPAISASTSCERPCSLRSLANSAATCLITFSEAISLMKIMIADLRCNRNVTNVTCGSYLC